VRERFAELTALQRERISRFVLSRPPLEREVSIVSAAVADREIATGGSTLGCVRVVAATSSTAEVASVAGVGRGGKIEHLQGG
jgi:hypothetical protein